MSRLGCWARVHLGIPGGSYCDNEVRNEGSHDQILKGGTLMSDMLTE